MKEYKILFADLDGTLIQTASGKTFAEDCTDFRIRKDVLDKIKTLEGLRFLHIVTNQGGVPQHISRKDLEAKLNGIIHFVQAYLNKEDAFIPNDTDVEVGIVYCLSMEKDNPCRMPNPGMLENFINEKLRFAAKWLKDKSVMLMIGDASGKPGQFSDSAKKCAENFGIDYLDVEDFLKA